VDERNACRPDLFRAALAAVLFMLAAVRPAAADGFPTIAPFALVEDYASAAILFEKNATEPMAPASTTEVLTAEIIFHELKEGRLHLDDRFLVSENAWRSGGGHSQMFLEVHSQVRIEDLIRGLVVQSGADAAIALAEGLAGTEDNFAELMNKRATELGMTHSHFTNPSGKGDPGQRVTARDMALLAAHIIREYPEYYKYFGEKEFTWNKIHQLNHNPLLTMDIGADGMKTSDLAESGFGLVGSAVQNGHRLIVVINGLKSASERADEARKLFNWGFRSFAPVTGASVVVSVHPSAPPPPTLAPVVAIAPQPEAKLPAPLPIPVAVPDRRVALVIGNSAYRAVQHLPNPSRDAELIGTALRSTGIEDVAVVHDLDRESTVVALKAFARKADAADWAIVYFAGHGIEIGGTNYLIPIDAKLETDRDVPFEAISLDQVQNAIEGAHKLKLIVLDACRNDPFAAQMKVTVTNRSIGRGLSPPEPTGGTLVVYAAKGGTSAEDGEGDDSPFALSFAKRIVEPGVEINKTLRFLRQDVLRKTGNHQEPFVYGSLPPDDFYFVPPK
jgi:D-alanyl-D-alanine carboxypeptidase